MLDANHGTTSMLDATEPAVTDEAITALLEPGSTVALLSGCVCSRYFAHVAAFSHRSHHSVCRVAVL